MSLISVISTICPIGVSHEHCPNRRPTKEFPDGCMFCQEKPERFKFSRFCPYYFKPLITKLSLEQFTATEYVFTTEDYFLPREIRDIVYRYCVRNEKEPIEIKLDEKGINHMMNCGKNCSKYFINFVNNNSCNHHILPRPKKHREHHRFA